MRIISLRRGFDADHSSSTYEFFALNKLTAEQRAAVEALTGELPQRHLQFHYQGDWRDIPHDWPDRLLTLGYDILVSESYDWWAVHMSTPLDPNLEERLQSYTCESDSNGFSVQVVGDRMILYFGMQLDYGAVYDAWGQSTFRGLAKLFGTVRDELLAGDLSAVWVMYNTYCGGDIVDEEPEEVKPLSKSAKTLLDIMESY
jgi:hypothetical protein